MAKKHIIQSSVNASRSVVVASSSKSHRVRRVRRPPARALSPACARAHTHTFARPRSTITHRDVSSNATKHFLTDPIVRAILPPKRTHLVLRGIANQTFAIRERHVRRRRSVPLIIRDDFNSARAIRRRGRARTTPTRYASVHCDREKRTSSKTAAIGDATFAPPSIGRAIVASRDDHRATRRATRTDAAMNSNAYIYIHTHASPSPNARRPHTNHHRHPSPIIHRHLKIVIENARTYRVATRRRTSTSCRDRSRSPGRRL